MFALQIKSTFICIALFTRKHVTETSHTPIELPLSQPKPSAKTRKNGRTLPDGLTQGLGSTDRITSGFIHCGETSTAQ